MTPTDPHLFPHPSCLSLLSICAVVICLMFLRQDLAGLEHTIFSGSDLLLPIFTFSNLLGSRVSGLEKRVCSVADAKSCSEDCCT